MMARIWRGATRAQDSNEYLRYLEETGIREYRETPGNRGVVGLRRLSGDRAEFVLLTLWDSEEAIRRFAGDEIDRAVFYPEDERYLVDKDDRVSHFEVVFQDAGGGS